MFRNTITVGIFYALPAFQLVLSEQQVSACRNLGGCQQTAAATLYHNYCMMSNIQSLVLVLCWKNVYPLNLTATLNTISQKQRKLATEINFCIPLDAQILNTSGNQDRCYFNFKCSHPLGVLSAFNNVWSNVGYFLLGFLFLIIVCIRWVWPGGHVTWCHANMVCECLLVGSMCI